VEINVEPLGWEKGIIALRPEKASKSTNSGNKSYQKTGKKIVSKRASTSSAL